MAGHIACQRTTVPAQLRQSKAGFGISESTDVLTIMRSEELPTKRERTDIGERIDGSLVYVLADVLSQIKGIRI
jgi:hypothetical protein